MSRESGVPPGATPRDHAALYAQAQANSARYGDFSAARQKIRAKFAHRDRPRPLPSPKTEEVSPPPPAPSRWYALQSILFPTQAAVENDNGVRSPTVAVFSAAGGVGKTCLVATLGRALSALAEEVLLVDTSAFGLLPFYFGAREVKPGVVRTFSAPVKPAQSDAPVRLLSMDTSEPDLFLERFLDQFVPIARGASRVLVDGGVAHRGLPDCLLSTRPTLLVPILPDMSSLACLASLEARIGGTSEILYLLNQFEDALPLHREVRAMLQQQLGSRLLPLVLHRSPAVSEALAEGLTVIDYAPASEVAHDYRQLAAWLRGLAAPAPLRDAGLRWTER